jgi:hypothetical protein
MADLILLSDFNIINIDHLWPKVHTTGTKTPPACRVAVVFHFQNGLPQ